MGAGYRGLEHGFARNACREVRNFGPPREIGACADEFVELQGARHDPAARFTKGDALEWVKRAEAAIASLRLASRPDRKAFAVQLLLEKRT
jgi:hypothetical protein